MAAAPDTHTFYKDLTAAGMPVEQAEVITQDILEQKKNFVTQGGLDSSLESLKKDVEGRFSGAKKDMEAGFSAAGHERALMKKDTDAGFSDAMHERALMKKDTDAGFSAARNERAIMKKDTDAGFSEAKSEREAGFSAARSERALIIKEMEARFSAMNEAMKNNTNKLFIRLGVLIGAFGVTIISILLSKPG